MILQEMTWPDVQDYLKTNDMVIIPLGSTEQHGPALPLGTDCFESSGIAKKISDRTKGPRTHRPMDTKNRRIHPKLEKYRSLIPISNTDLLQSKYRSKHLDTL